MIVAELSQGHNYSSSFWFWNMFSEALGLPPGLCWLYPSGPLLDCRRSKNDALKLSFGKLADAPVLLDVRHRHLQLLTLMSSLHVGERHGEVQGK